MSNKPPAPSPADTPPPRPASPSSTRTVSQTTRPISNTEKIHPLYKLLPLIRQLESAGVTPEAALRGSDVAAAALADPYALLSQRQTIAVLKNFLRLAAPSDGTPAPAWGLYPGLALGLGCRLSDLGLPGYGMHSSARLRDGYAFALRHQALSLPVADVGLLEAGDEACWSIAIAPEVAADTPLLQFVLGYQCGLLLAVQRHLAGPAFGPRLASFACPAPPHAADYHALLGCPLEFNAGQTRLHFARDWLDQPPPGAHAPTFRLIEQACDAILNRIDMDGGIIGAVQRMLLTQPQRLATIEQMAGQLGLHPRTLRRRIAHEGASYRDIVDQLRFRLAARYLADSDLTHEAISEQLGFSDASSFRRAFKRWARQSPQAFRHGGK